MKITKEILDNATKKLIKSCQYSNSQKAQDYAFNNQYPYWSDAVKTVLTEVIPDVEFID